jgi:hypothetical protein
LIIRSKKKTDKADEGEFAVLLQADMNLEQINTNGEMEVIRACKLNCVNAHI